MTAFPRAHSVITPALMLALGLTACDRSAPEPDARPAPMAPIDLVVSETPVEPEPGAPPPAPSSAAPTPTPAKPATPPAAAPAPRPPAATPARWDVSRTADGATATYLDVHGPILRITCTSRPARLRVNVPSFRPIGSEDRLSLGFGDNPIALVASRAGSSVTAVGELPPNIAARILRAPTISASYGRQVIGPFTAPRGAAAMTLANACAEAVLPGPPGPGSPLPGERRREQIPVNFRGEWNMRLQDCGTGRNDSALIVDVRTMRFYESHGEVTGVTRDGPRAISVDARYRGEGETWNRTVRMSLSGDLNRLTIDGMTRQRCPVGAEDRDRPVRRPGR